jgi:hypothetical protein
VANPTEDHPYFGSSKTIDILGGDYPRRMADMKLIMEAVSRHFPAPQVTDPGGAAKEKEDEDDGIGAGCCGW